MARASSRHGQAPHLRGWLACPGKDAWTSDQSSDGHGPALISRSSLRFGASVHADRYRDRP
jgi:hypothetical protein